VDFLKAGRFGGLPRPLETVFVLFNATFGSAGLIGASPKRVIPRQLVLLEMSDWRGVSRHFFLFGLIDSVKTAIAVFFCLPQYF
jgi:hypothetical protein